MKIVLGTWGMGGKYEPDPNNDDGRDINAIKHAISKGITHIDTAEMYADGKSEELVGKAIKDFPRESVFIATKVRAGKLLYQDVIKSCKESIKRLDTEYIDLFYVHFPNYDIPIKETAKAFNELLELGLIKNIGLSNVGIKTIKEYSKFLIKPIYAVQNQYSLIARESQKKGVINYCIENGIKFFSWRPILLSYPESRYSNLDSYPILTEIAVKYKKTNAQIAVRWLSQQDGTNVIVKSSSPKHIDEIIDTENFELSKDDWDKLDKEFPVQKEKSFTSSGYFDLV